jgi:DNA phosphorothioation-associated DGQHR protein 1
MKSYPAIRVLHPLGEFYLTAIPAVLLLEVCFSHRHVRHEADSTGHVKDKGHQRRLDKKRLKDISRYLQTQDAALPGTIILAANCTHDGEILDTDNGSDGACQRRWSIVPTTGDDCEVVKLEIPTREKLAAVVDGQHRLWGFEDVPDALKLTSLPCAVFIDLPTPQQAAIFATINFNQKPVNKSQTYELFGYNLDDEQEASWSPDKLAVFFTRKLNADDASPFKDHIKVAAQDDRVLDEITLARKKDWSVSTATIVEGILSLIARNPKEDRDLLHRRSLQSRSRKSALQLGQNAPPFRELYLSEDRDIVIYKTLINFFSAVNEVFWQGLPKSSKSLIRKTAGVQALFHVLKELLPNQLEQKDMQQASWLAVLRNAGALDFSNTAFFESSGRGRNRIRDSILVATERKQVAEITDEPLREYLKNVLNVEITEPC